MKKVKKAIYEILFVFKEIFLGMINALIMIAAGVIIASFFIYKYKLPDVNIIDDLKDPETTIIYDRTGETILYEIHGEENRKVLSHEEIPDVIRIATIAAEDKSFYSHHGFDVSAIVRAAKADFDTKAVVQGGSTITQQLARNFFLNREKTLSRKIKETLLAIKIENNFSKNEILDLYLNKVPYGSNAYGIEAAARTFFGKSAKNLTLDEAIFLSALPKAPSKYSPYGNYRNDLIKRQKKIYQKIKKMDVISKEIMMKSQETDTIAKILPFRSPIIAPHFVFFVIEELEKKYGRDFLETGGLRVRTTLDKNLQEIAENTIQEQMSNIISRGAENASLIAISPKTGEILAMVGSKNYFDTDYDGEVNVATSLRQPGSSIKPIIYAAAFEKGYQPETMIADVPTDFGPDGSGHDYIPNNYDGKFHGVLPMRKTLAMSLNIPAIKTLYAVGIDNAINMAEKLGITTFNDRKRYGLSLAIGGAEVKPLELTAAFSVFANDGKKNEAHAILEIKDFKNNSFIENRESKQVIDPQVARKISSILSDNEARSQIFGKNSPLNFDGRSVAAKTGTTQEFRDAWTVGYTPQIAVGVWTGNNNSKPMKAGSDGVFVAAPLWRKFMDQILPIYGQESFIGYFKDRYEASIQPKDEILMKGIKKREKNDNSDKKGNDKG